jgi:hypothetical protein
VLGERGGVRGTRLHWKFGRQARNPFNQRHNGPKYAPVVVGSLGSEKCSESELRTSKDRDAFGRLPFAMS